jgi:hypothetical protein
VFDHTLQHCCAVSSPKALKTFPGLAIIHNSTRERDCGAAERMGEGHGEAMAMGSAEGYCDSECARRGGGNGKVRAGRSTPW